MKAIVQSAYGSPNALHLTDIDEPTAGDDDVLVRVQAAGVDPGVWHLTAGLPYMVRLMGLGLRTPKARVPGNDVAGRVEAVGKNVTRLRPGDDVYGRKTSGDGSFAEYVCVPADRLAAKPTNLTFEQAAAVPVSATTALQGLRDKGQLQPGQTVLVTGAGGGVGTFAVQLAKAFGAEVTGVCDATKVGLVRLARRRPRDRPHPRRLRRRHAALRPHPRHRRKPTRVAAATRAGPPRDPRDRGRRRREPLVGRFRPADSASTGAVALRRQSSCRSPRS